MELLDLGHEDALQVAKRGELDVVRLELVQVALDGWDLERLLVEGVLSQRHSPTLAFVRLRLACLQLLICTWRLILQKIVDVIHA